ncbi:methyl-accepting chemotaxis protein [Novosphingobium sp. Chol11]|uniref:methyl-accepting chemotaxis protein n=1 Tax=Novosphingobium sp. Chol11 TaxID=1385763 RepID=UPI0025D81430|nr:methyl-accepting chemotaxis protein [Novosphingobium sp. Chol11]
MLSWFERDAPIRTKFRVLLFVHCGLAAITVLAAGWAALAGGPALPLIAALFVLVATAMTVLVSGKAICTPYVETVKRMEGLAAGDLASPILRTEHGDCVGRMSKAVKTFRANAVSVNELNAAQNVIVPPLREALAQLAKANLAHRVTEQFPANYELLRNSFNAAAETLQASIGGVAASTVRIQNASVEIRAASDDLAKRTEQQAASLQQASSDMRVVTALVAENTTSVVEVNVSVADAHREATNGGRVVEEAISAMTMIQTSSQEISQIINVIDGIAFQTNLLALNAGVEAARAGDAGRGFAVVANEVRALAQRSADAAREIKSLITTSGQHVERGVSLVGETGKALGQIVGRVGEVSQIVKEIAESATKQTEMLGNVNTTVGQMDTMTQQNAAMVEETTAAARSLAEEAGLLNDTVARFSHGGDAAPVRAALPIVAKPAFATVSPAMEPAPRRAPAKALPVSGNLAIKAAPDDSWSEF